MSKTFFQDLMAPHKDEVLVIPVRGINNIYNISTLARAIDESELVKSKELKQMYLDLKEIGVDYKYFFKLLMISYLNMDKE
ncbi:hypothetical protein COJ90_21360 [Priestia megaterium]|uniref:hypothetical protein n=1 Tax=Priestia megaterium TaxID=1404 RepID=UPI000BF5F554|nr:hypothetical protein [Priestia megaterium]PFP09263.1 hypothetical protein COJ90_21360 [Priestia megaterium]